MWKYFKNNEFYFIGMLHVLTINLTRVDEKISIIYDFDVPEILNKIEIIKNEKKIQFVGWDYLLNMV